MRGCYEPLEALHQAGVRLWVDKKISSKVYDHRVKS